MRYAPLLLSCLSLIAPVVAQADEPAYINDPAIRNGIQRQGTALIEAGTAVEYQTLHQQLTERSHYDAQPPAERELSGDAEALYDAIDDGVLVMAGLYLCGRCEHYHSTSATGFVISEDGLAVTNFHVLENDQLTTVVAMTRDGQVHPVIEVLAANQADDVALIRLGGDGFTPIPLARTAEVGQRVHAITHPNQQYYFYSSGEISRFFMHYSAPNQPPVRRVGISADYARGSSGGPIFNDRGQVVAMVCATRSIYAQRGGEDGPQNLQMVFHDCVPYASILDLFGPGQAAQADDAGDAQAAEVVEAVDAHDAVEAE